MIDGVAAMDRFVKLIASEPDICRVPLMIDSSKWEVIEAGLQVRAGQADRQLDLDEGGRGEVPSSTRGCAASTARRSSSWPSTRRARPTTSSAARTSARRAYRILVDEVGFPAEDIIFDPNIFAVATGIEEHATYGVDFIEATRWIKQNLPRRAGLRRRLQRVVLVPRQQRRCARRSTPCSSTTRSRPAWTWASSTPARSSSTTRSTRSCASASRTSILNRRSRRDRAAARDRRASSARRPRRRTRAPVEEWRALPVGERITHALVKGIDEFVEADTEELRQEIVGARRAPDRGHRGSADGRHERRRRPVRRRQDVPAAGGQVARA